MGRVFSKTLKNHKKDSAKSQSGVQNEQQDDRYEIYDPEKYHLEAIEMLRKEFKEDPEIFILNMLLMSYMFFDDYQKEIRTLANTSSERGKKLNLELIKDHQKQILMPDSVLESVNKRVKFMSSQGPNKDLMQPLVARRMFILHDTIEIEDKNVSVDYSRIDKPSYRADIEESKEHKGFIKVNLLGTSGQGDSETRTPSTDSASSNVSIKTFKRKSISSISKSGGGDEDQNTSESEYGYKTIIAAKTPKKLYITEKDIYTKISKLPSKCITPIKVKNEEILSDDSDSENEADDFRSKKRKRSIHEIELFRTKFYLNSVEFMGHFKNNIFPNTLGEVLGFTNESIHRATSIAGTIYCGTPDDIWEVIPAIPMPWPDEIAFEWTLRRRRTVWDKKEKTPIAYKWPTEKMVEEVNKLNCVVIPRGFMPKKAKNSDMHIEWEVGFPKAERFLEFRMSHAQMRMFMYMIILHKHFIEPLTQKHGLTIDHIRILMFWECEANYKAWPEHKLGTKLKLILKSLFDYLAKSQLPNYFIRNRNVLENVPRKYLLSAQNIIHRILETPLPYMMTALKQVKYTTAKFYSEPDIERLYEILTSETLLPHDAHLTVLAQTKAKQDEEIKRKHENNDRKIDKVQKWNNRYLQQQKIANAKKKLLKNNVEHSKNLNAHAEESDGSIDFDFSIKKRLGGDVVRQIALLTFFIQHFLQIAKRSIRISSTNQTLFYLKQSFYLTKLLEDIDIEKENAKQFQIQIKEEEENCLRKQVSEPKVPITPKRNSSYFANEILQVRGKEINRANLTKSYISKIVVNEPKSPILKANNSKVANKVVKNEENVIQAEVHEESVNKEINSEKENNLKIMLDTPVKVVKRVVSFKTADEDKPRNVIKDAEDHGETTSL